MTNVLRQYQKTNNISISLSSLDIDRLVCGHIGAAARGLRACVGSAALELCSGRGSGSAGSRAVASAGSPVSERTLVQPTLHPPTTYQQAEAWQRGMAADETMAGASSNHPRILLLLLLATHPGPNPFAKKHLREGHRLQQCSPHTS